MREALVVQIDDDYIYLMTDEMKMQKIAKKNNVVVGERISYQWYDLLPLNHILKGVGVGLLVLFFSLVLYCDKKNPVSDIDNPREKEIIVEDSDENPDPSIYYVESPFEQGEIMKERQLISTEIKTRDTGDEVQRDDEETHTTSEIKINLVDEEKP